MPNEPGERSVVSVTIQLDAEDGTRRASLVIETRHPGIVRGVHELLRSFQEAMTPGPVGPPDATCLHIATSESGDEVWGCRVVVDGRSHELKIRRHTHLLLELAAARTASGDGWVDQSVLMRVLALGPATLHQWTYRARQQLRAAGVPEDRVTIRARGERSRRQLRLVVDRVEIDGA